MITLFFFLLCFVGWVMNLFKLAGDTESMMLKVFRIIGIFIFPMGALLGYLF
jgi:hypothetical protein